MCAYRDLAEKLQVHRTFGGSSPGFQLAELEMVTIIEALKYTANWKLAIEAAEHDAAHQQS